MAVDIAPSFGSELKDGFKPVNSWVGNGIAWLDDLQSFYKERSAIEKEYSKQLTALAKKYHDKKAKKQSVLSVGETPTVTPGSLESASMTTWSVQLTTLEARATEHDRFANALAQNIVEPLKTLATRCDELRKHHVDYAARLEKERDSVYSDLKKTKGKYDVVCQEVENRRKKTEADHGRGKAASVFHQQQEEMRNTKNTYLIAINVTNKHKERYFHEYVPDLLDSLQDLSETRVSSTNSLWSTAANLEAQLLGNSTELVQHMTGEITRNVPSLDSMMFARHNPVNWQEPQDFSFEPSPVWLDDDTMAADEVSKTFLRNILLKSKASMLEHKRVFEDRKREVDKAKYTRQAIRDGKEKSRDEVEVVRTQFMLTESLHEAERKKVTAEVEVSTISSAVGDLSIGATKHAFKAQTYKIPTNCDLCGERIWGLSAKGFDCTACGFTCHSKCELKVPADCPGEVEKEKRKRLKVERQAAAQAATPVIPNGDDRSHASVDTPRLSRSDTIGSMNTLSSGYGTSAQKSIGGISKSVDEGSKIAATGGPRRSRLVAPPPTHYVVDVPPDHRDRGRMMYAYTSNGDDEITVADGQEITVLEADDGSGWIKVQSSTGEEGLVPASYVDVLPRGPPIPERALSIRSGAASASVTSLPGSISSSGTGAGKKVGPAVAPKRGRKKVKRVEALYTYDASGDGQTSMTEGEHLVLINSDQGDGWCEVERTDGSKGFVPASWVKEV